MMMHIADLLDDVQYLSGAKAPEVLTAFDDLDATELLYSVSQLKILILAKLMQEEDKS